MTINEIMKILPHRHPILLVDRVSELIKNESIIAYKNVSINEDIFNGHFPKYPIYPGVMILEGLAQASSLLVFESLPEDEDKSNLLPYFTGIDKAKFRKPVVPGDRLEYRVKLIKSKLGVWKFDGKAYVDDKLVAQAEIKAMVNKIN